jgi:hypothetical protein
LKDQFCCYFSSKLRFHSWDKWVNVTSISALAIAELKALL